MENLRMEKRVARAGFCLRLLSAVQSVAGVCILSAVLFLLDPETLGPAAGEIMTQPATLVVMAVFLLLFVTASGLVSLFRIRYGWFFVFFVATLLLLTAVLQGPGTILLTRVSFWVMMALSGVSWALAVVYYLWDLYT